MNRYIGNTGRRIRVPEELDAPAKQRDALFSPAPAEKTAPPSPQTMRGHGGEKLQNSSEVRFHAPHPALPFGMDAGDLLLFTVLLLLYKESGDTDFLILLAVVAVSILRSQP